MIYGTPLVKVETDVTDLIGIRTLVLGMMWQPSASTLTQEQIDAEQPGIPPIPGGLLLVGVQTRPFGGAYRTSWTFEGINGDGKTVTFKGRANSFDYGFDPGFAQIPIQQHPLFAQLLQQYGGYADVQSGSIIWPQLLPASNTSSVGMAGPQDSSGTTTNPMFGHDDWRDVNGTYRHRYAATALPGNLYNQVGLIFSTDRLPGGPPQGLPDPSSDAINGRNWLKAPPVYKRRGLIYDITELYLISQRGGWVAPLYSVSLTGATT